MKNSRLFSIVLIMLIFCGVSYGQQRLQDVWDKYPGAEALYKDLRPGPATYVPVDSIVMIPKVKYKKWEGVGMVFLKRDPNFKGGGSDEAKGYLYNVTRGYIQKDGPGTITWQLVGNTRMMILKAKDPKQNPEAYRVSPVDELYQYPYEIQLQFNRKDYSNDGKTDALGELSRLSKDHNLPLTYLDQDWTYNGRILSYGFRVYMRNAQEQRLVLDYLSRIGLKQCPNGRFTESCMPRQREDEPFRGNWILKNEVYDEWESPAGEEQSGSQAQQKTLNGDVELVYDVSHPEILKILNRGLRKGHRVMGEVRIVTSQKEADLIKRKWDQ